MQYILTIMLRPLQYHNGIGPNPQTSLVYRHFISEILSLSRLSQRIPPTLLTLFVSSLPTILSLPFSDIPQSVDTLALFGNLCSLATPLLQYVQAASKPENAGPVLVCELCGFAADFFFGLDSICQVLRWTVFIFLSKDIIWNG